MWRPWPQRGTPHLCRGPTALGCSPPSGPGMPTLPTVTVSPSVLAPGRHSLDHLSPCSWLESPACPSPVSTASETGRARGDKMAGKAVPPGRPGHPCPLPLGQSPSRPEFKCSHSPEVTFLAPAHVEVPRGCGPALWDGGAGTPQTQPASAGSPPAISWLVPGPPGATSIEAPTLAPRIGCGGRAGGASTLDPKVGDQKDSRSRGGSAGEEAPPPWWEQLPPCRPRPRAGRGGGNAAVGGGLPLSSRQPVALAASPWGGGPGEWASVPHEA